MATQVCVKCGGPNPEHTLRYVAVDVKSDSVVSYSGGKRITTTTTTESIAGVEKCHVCDECVRKRRRLSAVGDGIALMIGALFIIMLSAASFGGSSFSENALIIFAVALAISTVLGLLNAFFYAMRTETPFVAARLLKEAKGQDGVGKAYIPTDAKLYSARGETYPVFDVFRSKTGLKSQVGALVFTQFIASGIGDQLVDALLLSQQQDDGAGKTSDVREMSEGKSDAVSKDAPAPSSNGMPAKMKGWVFSCYDHDRVQSLSMFQNTHDFYSEGNVIKMVRDWMKLPEGEVVLQYIPAPSWNAPDVKATESSFDCDIDLIYAQAIDHLVSHDLCSRTAAIAAARQNMPYPKPGLLLLVFLIAA